MDLNINNVINISVAQTQNGIGQYNTSNIALFSSEAYNPSFGSDGYKIYLGPTEVATDFGTDSETFKMANALFSQQPNILANRGYLVVIPKASEVQSIIFDGVAVSGSYELNFDGAGPTAAINYDDDAATVQAAIRTLAGLESAVVTGSAGNFSVSFAGYNGEAPLMTVSNNTMQDGGAGTVTPVIAEVSDGETLGEAITRTQDLVQYFGIMDASIVGETEGDAAAAIVQPLNKILMLVSRTEADVEPDAYFDLIRQASYSKTRCLYFGADNDSDALTMMASYTGRAFSTNFNGSNTTQTMHLKDLIGVVADPTMTQTLLGKCQDAGVDVYASIQGVPKTFTSGENQFFDDVYNLAWLVGALEVAGFNVLAQASTKIPQTEGGVDTLKGAYRAVCEQGVTNQFIAAGQWNNPVTFGIQEDLYNNISERGYYIYSQPVSQQLPTEREAREAPLIQIAVKYAGAIHSSTVIVNINK